MDTTASVLDLSRRLVSVMHERVSRSDGKTSDVCDEPVLWLTAAPSGYGVGAASGQIILQAEPAVEVPFPSPPPLLADWFDPDIAPDSLGAEPRLRTASGSAWSGPGQDVRNAFKAWSAERRTWVRARQEAQQHSQQYADLRQLAGHRAARNESYELVLGVGLVTIVQSALVRHRRHLLTAAVQLETDPAMGSIRVVLPPNTPLRLEHHRLLTEAETPYVRRCESDVLVEEHPLSQRVASWLSHWANQYWIGDLDTDLCRCGLPEVGAATYSALTWSPALFWRHRAGGQAAFYQTIGDLLRTPDAKVPLGWAQLVTPIEPDQRRSLLGEGTKPIEAEDAACQDL